MRDPPLPEVSKFVIFCRSIFELAVPVREMGCHYRVQSSHGFGGYKSGVFTRFCFKPCCSTPTLLSLLLSSLPVSTPRLRPRPAVLSPPPVLPRSPRACWVVRRLPSTTTASPCQSFSSLPIRLAAYLVSSTSPCTCTDADFLNNTEKCLQEKCSAADQAAALQINQQLCGK